jgi:hypothetical protein
LFWGYVSRKGYVSRRGYVLEGGLGRLRRGYVWWRGGRRRRGYMRRRGYASRRGCLGGFSFLPLTLLALLPGHRSGERVEM